MNPPPNGEVKAVGRGRKAWRADQNIELRRPQTVTASSVPELSDSGNGEKKDEVSESLSLAVQSNLSVNAKEFVPKFQTSTAVAEEPQHYESSSNSYYDYYEQDEDDISHLSSEEWFILHFNDVIHNLTLYPGNFELVVKPLLHELIPLLAAEETKENIVMAIINQAIPEPNFRYNAARLCNALNKRREPEAGSAFRRVLLNKLCEEHEKMATNLVNNPDRVYGLLYFMAELYIQLEITKGQGPIVVLGDALLLALKELIQIPTLVNIKNTCNILKLSGRMLDAGHSDADSFFASLQKVHDDETVGNREKAIISNILKLRNDNWGHGSSADSTSTSTTSSINEPSGVANEGTYYGPDNKVLTAEECKFLDENCERDETVSVGEDPTIWDPNANEHENAEIMEAFQEFVNQKHHS